MPVAFVAKVASKTGISFTSLAGRRVWPPNFKRFIKAGLENGEMSVRGVLKASNVSQALIYKWRSDVRCTGSYKSEVRDERVFSEITVVDDTCGPSVHPEIVLRNEPLEKSLLSTYPVSDLVHKHPGSRKTLQLRTH